MSAPALPRPAALPQLVAANDTPTLRAILDTLFEPSTALHELALPFFELQQQQLGAPDVYERLVAHVRAALTGLLEQSPSAPDKRAALDAILAAHPRLGAPKVDSAQSRAEQAQLGGDAMIETLAALNEDYERAFPGLRYVVFVAGRPRDDIMADMRARIARGDAHAERAAAIEAMCDIALDRASKLLA